MDTLARLLDTSRARGAFALRTVMCDPWSIRVRTESPLTLIACVRGSVWIRLDGYAPVCGGPGDIIITRGPAHYTLAHQPDYAPRIIVDPGQQCRSLSGQSLHQTMTLGIRTWGNDPQGKTHFLVGSYDNPGDINRCLLSALPPVMTLKTGGREASLVHLLEQEIHRSEPAQTAVLDRLLDLLLTSMLAVWFSARQSAGADARVCRSDRTVHRAVLLIDRDPAVPWTLERLAKASGASRAALARRFRDLVGEPPMTYLTNRRLALAADLLCNPGETVSSVAATVGYSSPYAFSAAFKRVRGVSPRDHQSRCT